MFPTSHEIRKKKTIVLVVAVLFVGVLMAITPAYDTVWRTVMHLTPTSERAIGRAETETPTTTHTVQVSPSATVMAAVTATQTATPVPDAPEQEPTATPTVQQPTPTPTRAAPTSTATATLVPETPTKTPTATVTPTPSPIPPATVIAVATSLPEDTELGVPAITSPVTGLETKETQIQFEGTAPSNATIILYDRDVPYGVTTADAEGNWQFTSPEPLSETEHVFVARTTDGTRVSQPSREVRVIVIGERLPITGGN